MERNSISRRRCHSRAAGRCYCDVIHWPRHRSARVAAFFGVLFLERWIYLARYAAETSNKITAVMGHVRDGLSLRDDLLNQVIETATEREKALVQWSESVERWIEEEEPDYFSDFKTAVPGIVVGVTSSNLGRQSSFYVHINDAQLGALRELMADLRTRR